jgi:uncharacterized protein
MNVPSDDPRANALTAAIQRGECESLEQLLRASPELAAVRIFDKRGGSRTLLHIAADWPGHFPNGARTVGILIAAGADVNARVTNVDAKFSPETALHWAASSDDVAVLDALLDGGANIEADGAIFTNGTAMSDAVVFANWKAARRLLKRGATTTIWQAAALGLLSRVREFWSVEPIPDARTTTNALWHACSGGHLPVVEYLCERGANINWIGYDERTPYAVALERGDTPLAQWLRAKGARRAEELE